MVERERGSLAEVAGIDAFEGDIPLEFLDQIPKNLLHFIVRESLRSPIRRLIEAAMVGNDAILAGLEADAYIRDPYKGADMYEQNGPTVVIGPGFGAKGRWYGATKTFLKNAGFRAVIYGEDEYNLKPLEHQVPDFVEFVKDQTQIAGGKVDLWLHSKAGLMGYGAYSLHTKDMVENVDRVVAIGTGLTNWVNPLILGGYYGSQFAFKGRDFEWAKQLRFYAQSTVMEGLRVTTIAKKTDPIMRADYFGTDHKPIEGSHIGNGWSLETMRLGVNALRAGNAGESRTSLDDLSGRLVLAA